MLNVLLIATALVSANEHPKVEAPFNLIDMEVSGNADYTGPLYIGSKYPENRVVYDTMSDWTVIIGDTATGASHPGNYNPFRS